MPADHRPINYTFDYDSYLFEPEVSFEKGLRIQKANNHMQKFQKVFQHELINSICIFIDGSKSNAEIGGFAIHKENNNHQRRTSKYASIFTIEAMAIIESLKIIDNTAVYILPFSVTLRVF